jgi:hypothetical protein
MPPAHSVQARTRTWPQRFLVITGCLVVALCVGTASVAAYLGIRFGQITRVGDIDLAARTGEAANYLLVGTDSREGIDEADPDAGGFLGDTGCECTDTIMVVRVDPKEKQAYLLSFPRDLYLPISGTGETARINTAHAHGAQTLIDTIQDNFDIPIHHYVEIDFVGSSASRSWSTRWAVCRSGSTPRCATETRGSTSPPPAAWTSTVSRLASSFGRGTWSTRTRTATGTATPPPTSVASPASRPSYGARWRRRSTRASATR